MEQVEVTSLPPAVTGPYRTVVGDVLEILFYRTSELNQTQTVGPDGTISLMPVGSVRAAGITLEELTQEVMRRYSEELVEPEVTVRVKEYAGLRIYVGGEVFKAGMFPYSGGLTLVQAVMNAGGFKPSARLDEVVLIRKGQDSRPVGSIVNLKEILHKAQFADDVPLAPSDVIFVPRSKIANVNIWVDQYIRQNIPFNLWLGFNLGGG
jgi:protein involved in polysaccharide export with SLBB domain